MKKNKLPSIITILILTLVTVVAWISLNIYWALSKKPAPIVPQEVSEPLTPTLDTDSLDRIQSRLFLNDSQIPEVNIATPVAPPVAIATPEPIPSEAPTTKPEATP